MSGKVIGYVRVSTTDQNPDRQLEGVSVHKKFIDYASGSTMKRPELEKMMEYAREDDTIVIHSMDRLGRNIRDLRNIIDEMVSKGIKVHFVRENLLFSSEKNSMSNLILMLFGAVAEFELEKLKERQREGIEQARKAGKYQGRKPSLNKEKIEFMQQQLSQTRCTKTQLARELGISRFTLYKYIEMYPILEKKTA